MIVEIVTFDLPEDLSRDEVVARYESTVAGWQANPDLVRKYYLLDVDGAVGGGVYLWPNLEAARAAHDAAWCARAEAMYGAPPRFAYFEAPIIVDNTGG